MLIWLTNISSGLKRTTFSMLFPCFAKVLLVEDDSMLGCSWRSICARESQDTIGRLFTPGFPLSSVGFSVSKLEWSPWNIYFQLPFLGEMFQKNHIESAKIGWRNFEEIFGSCHTLLQCRTLQSWDISHSDKVGSMLNNTYIYIYITYIMNHWIDSIARSWQGRHTGKRWKICSFKPQLQPRESNHQIFETRCHHHVCHG